MFCANYNVAQFVTFNKTFIFIASNVTNSLVFTSLVNKFVMRVDASSFFTSNAPFKIKWTIYLIDKYGRYVNLRNDN